MNDSSVLAPARGGVPFREAVRVWVRVALLSFGGPAGQIAVMHRIVVEEKRWLSERRFLHALNYCMVLPGPEAQQLATYIGWLMHGTAGGVFAGVAFILPGAIAIMALSFAYAAYGELPAVAALFFGLKAAVLAVVVEAVLRIGKRALRTRAMIAVAAVAFVSIFFFAAPFPLIILAAAAAGLAIDRADPARGDLAASAVAPGRDAPSDDADPVLGDDRAANRPGDAARALRVSAACLALWLVPAAAVIALAGSSSVYSQIAIFFSKMAMVTFGGAYAVLAYVAQQAAEHYGWLTPTEMLDGLGMAETTPGPLIMVLQFVGFMAAFRDPGALPPLVAGALGGLLATWVTFVPCFLWIFLGAPFIEKLRGNRNLTAALTAVTAAVVGVILNLALWFAIHCIFREVRPFRAWPLAFDLPTLASIDPWAALLAAGAAVALLRLKAGMLPTLLGSCAAGLSLHAAGLLD